MFLLLLALALTLAGTASFTASGADAAADMDCADFATQAEAQAFFVAAGPGDPHALDYDGDGIACESNPAPYYYGTTPPSAPQPPPAAPTTPAEIGRASCRERV